MSHRLFVLLILDFPERAVLQREFGVDVNVVVVVLISVNKLMRISIGCLAGTYHYIRDPLLLTINHHQQIPSCFLIINNKYTQKLSAS